MRIVKQWIVSGYKHLVKLENGIYMLGSETNQYGFYKISKKRAKKLIRFEKKKYNELAQ